MTSLYQIVEDCEKENPHNNCLMMKEKSMAMVNKPNILQLISGVIPQHKDDRQLQQQQQQQHQYARGNFSALNSNANTRIIMASNHNNMSGNNDINSNFIHNNKNQMALREVCNVTSKDNYMTIKKPVTITAEDMKTFVVYEDEQDENNFGVTFGLKNKQQQLQKQKQIYAEDEGKENIYLEKQPQRCQTTEISQTILTEKSVLSLSKYGGDNNECMLDATVMSVSDVLSPMSVDRSSGTLQLRDDYDSKHNATMQIEYVHKLHAHRQRFFEVVEYQNDIIEYMRESETKHRPKPHYMRRQTDINHSMRAILVDWLVEVSEEYNLNTETLYLSVSYTDRFLSHMSVVRNKLQLVGTAAMYVASKFEEIYPPDVSEFVFITDDTYNKAQVLRMEQIILKILAFDLCTPTAYTFINAYSVLVNIPDVIKHFAMYLSELSLLEADPYLRFFPSMISSGALALAYCHHSNYPIWSERLAKVTSYTIQNLKEIFLYLCKTHNSADTLAQQAIQEKYKAKKYNSVSAIPPIVIDEEQFDTIIKEFLENIDDKGSLITGKQL